MLLLFEVSKKNFRFCDKNMADTVITNHNFLKTYVISFLSLDFVNVIFLRSNKL